MKQSKEWIRLPAAAAAIAVFCTLLWGTAFPCIKIGYELFRIDSGDVPSKFVFAGWRFFGAGILVMVIGLIRRPSVMKLHRRDIIPIGVLGLFQTFLQYLLLYSGLVYVSGTKSSIFTSVSAFGSVVLSAICFRSDRLTVRKIGGCLIGVAGILIMNAGGDGWDSFTLTGDGFVILSNLCGAVGNVISKKIAGGRDALQISAWQLIFGGGALTAIIEIVRTTVDKKSAKNSDATTAATTATSATIPEDSTSDTVATDTTSITASKMLIIFFMRNPPNIMVFLL